MGLAALDVDRELAVLLAGGNSDLVLSDLERPGGQGRGAADVDAVDEDVRGGRPGRQAEEAERGQRFRIVRHRGYGGRLLAGSAARAGAGERLQRCDHLALAG